MTLAVPPSFLVGLVAAPLAKRVLKPLLRGVVKASVGVAYEIRRATAEAEAHMHGIAAEVTAETAAASAGDRSAARVPKARADTGAGNQP
ncbi:DUF5132 domain-containing protein [Streptomyces olivaceus]|uniref:DUF5132 domain-containing protein n=1 Tax=Streptomyces olivaceus TaxID=47716 RepID=UPI0022EDDEB3|nr:DUF5132 domain-containing protein [Streptomyces olivaceus]GHI93816.1 hypothetical protein TPA0905_32870 [Streptomyces olivaceus]